MKTGFTRIPSLFLVILLLSFSSGIAQPTLTSASNGITGNIGKENYSGIYNTVVAPGNSGASQTWDFSAISASSGSSQYYYNCVSPICDSFPGSNFYSQDLTNYSVFMSTSTSATILYGASSSGIKTKYSDPEELMHFPFSYGNTYVDSFRFTNKFGTTLTAYDWGVDSVLADAWGTIKTPTGTYSNSLRIRKISNSVDSSAPASVTYSHSIQYSWYSTTQTDYVFRISSSTTTGAFSGTSNSATWIGQTSGVSPINESNRIILGPNPVTDQLSIAFQATQNASGSVTILDMTGRNILEGEYQIKSGQNLWKLDLSQIASGMYLLSIQDGNNRFIRRFQKL